jgi:hypothetical protein
VIGAVSIVGGFVALVWQYGWAGAAAGAALGAVLVFATKFLR